MQVRVLLLDPIRSFNHVAVTGTATAAPAKRVHAGSSPARNSNQPKPGWQMRSLHPTENREEHARYVPQAPFFKLVSAAHARCGFRFPTVPAYRARSAHYALDFLPGGARQASRGCLACRDALRVG